MRSLDVFLSRLLPQVTGCPDIAVAQALVDSAIEFCEETSLTRYTSTPQNIVAGTAVYDIDLPPQQAVSTTMQVWYGTTLLVPAAKSDVDAILAYIGSAGGETAPRSAPRTYFEIEPGQIALYPVPDVSLTAGLSARVATKPLRSATQLEDILYEDWVEAIVAGALMRLHAVPNQPYSDDARAAMNALKFRQAINRASTLAEIGRVRASRSVVLGGGFA